jgi:hypothetical protein
MMETEFYFGDGVLHIALVKAFMAKSAVLGGISANGCSV